jgi:translation initiation factor 2B subunit (eIF-2B alpha/beta/delta family)
MPERRFEHVEELKEAGLTPPDDATLHFLWQIVDEGVLGASRHVALGNELLLHILNSVPDRWEALLRVRMAARFIARTRGHDTPVIGNSLTLLLAGLDDIPERERATALRTRIQAWAQAAAARKKRLTASAVAHLANVRGVMAFDYSSTVSAIVLALAATNRNLTVVVPESRTISGGARYLEEFLPAGLTVRFLPDAAIEYGLGFCDAALFGVETLRCDGGFLNTIGSRMIAKLARGRGIEVYGCTDLLKLDLRSYSGCRPEPALRSYDETLLAGLGVNGLQRAVTTAPELEVIPAELTTAILTEHGAVPPQAIWSLGRETFPLKASGGSS